ncbi:hypothetical protein SDC9_53050 [bioreactor metagenome]|uniref:TonB-dependent receptor SusC n=1 Tax=bioreactor metagenome TaxID=1076179 RepID=A0A644WSV0_9ZZZZ
MKKIKHAKETFLSRQVFILALVLFLCQATNMYSKENVAEDFQQKKVTLNSNGELLTKAIETIIKQSGSEIVFFNSQIGNIKCGKIQLTSVTVETALEEILRGTGFGFVKQDGRFVIKESPNTPKETKQNNPGIEIRGRVTDESGEPLPGAWVIVKGTSIKVYTNMDGEYQITVPGVNSIIQVFFLGMENKEFKITSPKQTIINFTCKIKENTLQEAVFVSTGYQKMSRRDMVGALTTVNAEDINMPNYASIDQMLQGIVPGMIVSNSSSRVGTSPSIQIRGTSTLLGDTQPLWVVDGIIQEDPIKINASTLMSDDIKNIIGNQVSWLNPMDIETITVLKDASSTAIYGSKASNGVIVITTKQAKANQERLSINYSSSLTINSRPNYGQFNLMNSQERIQFSDEVFGSGVPYSQVPYYDYNTYEGVKRLYIEGYISLDEFNEKRRRFETVNTDWFKLLTRTGLNHTHNLSLMGRSQSTTYTASASYTKQQGQEIGNDSERFTGRISLGFKIRENMRLNVSITGSYGLNTGFGQGVSPLHYATNTSRAVQAYDELGELSYYQRINTYKYNKLVPTLSYNIINERDNSGSFTESMRLSSNLDFTWNLFKGISYNLTGGYNYNVSAMESYLSEQTYSIANSYRGYDFETALPQSVNFKAAMLPFGGALFTNDARQKSYNIQNKIAFNQLFRSGKDRLNILLGHELRSGTNLSTANTVWGYSLDRGQSIIQPTIPAEVIPTAGANGSYTGFGILSDLYSGRWKKQDQTNNFMSLFGTLAYSVDNKYIFNASIRNDFSNRFGQNVNKRIDPTYSFGLSWRVSEEDFVRRHLSFISQLNLRATYGIQGNALTNVSPELILVKQGKKNVFEQYYSTISKIPNPHLKWERTTNWNIGGDVQLFNKVSLTFDYYTRRSNAIISQDVPYEMGIPTSLMNGGIIHNRGLEGTLTFAPINTKEVGLALSFNSSKNWNKTGEPVGEIMFEQYLSGKAGSIIKEGYPLDAFWSYSFAGLDPQTGAAVFNLMDTPVDIAKADPTSFLEYSGERTPSISGGLGINFRYRSFSVRSGFSLMMGGKTRLPSPYTNFWNGIKLPGPESNISKSLNDRWKKPGDEKFTNIPGIHMGNIEYKLLPNEINSTLPLEMWEKSTAMVVDASFLRCRDLSITWRANEKNLKKIKFSSIAVTASVNNLFVIASKRFNGFDPELKDSVLPKSYSLSVSIGF